MPDEPESGSLVRLSGSERAPLAGARPAGPLDESARAEVTLVLRRRAELPDDVPVLTPAELAERYGADPADVERVRAVLAGRGLEVTGVHPGSRRVKVAGTVGDLARAFGTTLRQVASPDPAGRGTVTHRYREGPLYLPAELDGIVVAVLGLDTRQQARPHLRARAAAATGPPYQPNQVADVDGFPAGTTGAGQTVAVIELGGGFSGADLVAYFGGLGLPVPSVTAVGVDGAANAPGSDPAGADVEVALDIEVIGAAAPGAAQVVYFAPNNGDQGFVDAISDAAQPHCDFPASSPHALGCGGTRLSADPATGVISSEVVWNETAAGEGAGGGGVSDQFPRPSWQANAGVPARAGGGGPGPGGRGVPDVAGNADPATGYQILSGGTAQVVGGTSAVAPLWSALIARLAEATGARFGLIQPALYAGVSPGADVPGFRDITSGSNGAYAAGPGWDACTGLGSPDGAALLARLRG